MIIAGAGIGGLTLALSLHQVGIKALVLEAVRTLQPLGVGINVLPHASRELSELELDETLARTGVATTELAYFSKHGKPIWREPRGRHAGYDWPQYSIHRGRLQAVLLEAAIQRLGPEAFRFGHQLSRWEDHGQSIDAICLDRDDGDRLVRHSGSLLIAADGIHSTARARLYPNEGPPLWNGAILWRGVSHATPFLDGRTMAMIGHGQQKFVTYPITTSEIEQGPALVNWIAELKFAPDHQWRREDWNRAGRLDDFLPRFQDWCFDWLDVPALIRGARDVFEYPMVDRDPLPCWTHGAMTLLGDAAHPMYPIGSNGASQAILDARVLTRELVRHGPGADALRAYEAERRPATAKIVEANRRSGPDEVLDLVEHRAPDGFEDIERVLPLRERQAIADRYKQVAGFDKDALNRRPAIVPGRA
ncbi:MAG: flavin-dependent oxidoreductase [Gammaproteobacteria bacterium]|nr:flavin-dependent oxidoreductase [Gammaproteobacteria bacterium]